ncbi:MAG: hypothetical protein ACTFAK_09860 [Candidatus Electronema sp. VV]
MFRNIFPSEEQGGRGRPAAPSRNILNLLLYILIVGCRWCDLPRGPQWASKKAQATGGSSHGIMTGRSIRSKRDCSVLLRMMG